MLGGRCRCISSLQEPTCHFWTVLEQSWFGQQARAHHLVLFACGLTPRHLQAVFFLQGRVLYIPWFLTVWEAPLSPFSTRE